MMSNPLIIMFAVYAVGALFGLIMIYLTNDCDCSECNGDNIPMRVSFVWPAILVVLAAVPFYMGVNWVWKEYKSYRTIRKTAEYKLERMSRK